MRQEDLSNAVEEPVSAMEAGHQCVGFGQQRFLADVGAEDKMSTAKSFDDFIVGAMEFRSRFFRLFELSTRATFNKYGG